MEGIFHLQWDAFGNPINADCIFLMYFE